VVSMLLRRSTCVAAIRLALLALPLTAQARDATPTNDAVATMSAGDYLWNNAVVVPPAASNIRIVVSIADQKLYLYRAARLVAVSTVSTGKPGHDTPTGDFKILQKAVKHLSNQYDDASMPYMQRITWDGVAIHAGRDPGYAASHGCVRVPIAFAKRLYAITRLGARVTITDESLADMLPAAPAAAPLEAPSAPAEPMPVSTALTATAPADHG
jgi:lipoprotein-anchoring transpeptidase ErfK/SrfK